MTIAMDKYIAGNRDAWNIASVYHHNKMADKWLEGFKTPGHTSFDEFDYNLYNQTQESRVFYSHPLSDE